MIEYLEEYTFFKHHIQKDTILKNLFILYLSKLTTGTFVSKAFGISTSSIYYIRKKNRDFKGTFWGSIDYKSTPYIIRQQDNSMTLKILELKKEYPTLGSTRLHNLLRFKEIDPLPSLSTVKRVLAKYNS
jgi:hypothetical protein